MRFFWLAVQRYTVSQGGEDMMAEVWGGWLLCIQPPEADNECEVGPEHEASKTKS